MLRKYLLKLMENSVSQNHNNILSLVEISPSHKIIDLGCDDGHWTQQIAKHIQTKNIEGVELIKKQADKAKKKGIKVYNFDLNSKTNLLANQYDVVHTNQVIEHLTDVDTFLKEIKRILKKNGYLILSTENLSSWHNIIALTLGYQPFSMTNVSTVGSIGNPFALWKETKSTMQDTPTWVHNKLFSYFGLKDLLEKHGFKVEKIKTAGYYPLPGFFTQIDPYHGHWITIKARLK